MSHYADEQYDVYHEVRVFARKPHECDAVMCTDPIRVGDPYWRISTVYDGRAETIKRCVRCQAIHEHLRTLGDDTWPDERLDCGEWYRDHWGEDPPPEIQALAFWRPGERLPCDSLCTVETSLRADCYDWRRRWRQYDTAHFGRCKREDVDSRAHRNPCS